MFDKLLKTIILIILLVLFSLMTEASSLLSGISLRNEGDSVVIHDIKSVGKMWEAGIRVGDVIIQIDNQKINTLDEYVKKSKSINSYGIVKLLFSHNGKEYTIIKNGNNYQRKNEILKKGEKSQVANTKTPTTKETYNQLAKIRKNVLQKDGSPSVNGANVVKTKTLQVASPTDNSELKVDFKAEPTKRVAPLEVKFADISEGKLTQLDYAKTDIVEDVVEPFGNLTWEDGLLDVVAKLNNI